MAAASQVANGRRANRIPIIREGKPIVMRFRRPLRLWFVITTAVVLLLGVSIAATAATSHHTARQADAPNAQLPSAFCGAVTFPLFAQYDSNVDLAWVSHQVITGTVAERLPSVWGEPVVTGTGEELSGPPRTIYTDYVVRVEDRLRGQPLDTVLVRIEGGAIDDCVIMDMNSPVPEIGDHVMLFLYAPPGTSDTGTYFISGGVQGWWKLDADGYVQRVPTGYPDEFGGDHNEAGFAETRVLYQSLAVQILGALQTGAVPVALGGSDRVVSLASAPINPTHPLLRVLGVP